MVHPSDSANGMRTKAAMIDLPRTSAAIESLATALATNNREHRAIYLEALRTVVRLARAESESAAIIAIRQDILQVDAIREASMNAQHD